MPLCRDGRGMCRPKAGCNASPLLQLRDLELQGAKPPVLFGCSRSYPATQPWVARQPFAALHIVRPQRECRPRQCGWSRHGRSCSVNLHMEARGFDEAAVLLQSRVHRGAEGASGCSISAVAAAPVYRSIWLLPRRVDPRCAAAMSHSPGSPSRRCSMWHLRTEAADQIG